MWTRSAGFVLVFRVVFLGQDEQPTICSHTESSRLLHQRLEVLAAALHQLEMLRSNAANAPRAVEVRRQS